MATTALSPELEEIKQHIEDAFPVAGGAGKDYTSDATDIADAGTMAARLLSAYHVAATLQPDKAYRPKAFTPGVQLSDSRNLALKSWWNDVLDVVTTVGPVIIDAVSKDYQPPQPHLNSIIQQIPRERRNDKDFVDYATTVLLTLANATVQSLSGTKDFTAADAQVEVPEPPAGKDKGWFDDVCDFVSDAAPVVVPLVMSAL
jgi:hypothetical protein